MFEGIGAREGATVRCVLRYEEHDSATRSLRDLEKLTSQVEALQKSLVASHSSKVGTVRMPFTGPSYRVVVKLNNAPINAYIDTGSVVSLVTEDLVRGQLDVEIQPLSDLGEVDSNFTTANGDKLLCVEFIAVNLSISSAMNQSIIPNKNKLLEL